MPGVPDANAGAFVLLQGVVSFHGLLQSEPQNMLQAPDWDGTVNMEGVVDAPNAACKV